MDVQATFPCSFTQSDLGPAAKHPSLPDWPAQRLLPQERQDLAIQVLAGIQPVSDLAREHEVSRNTVRHGICAGQKANKINHFGMRFAPAPDLWQEFCQDGRTRRWTDVERNRNGSPKLT